MLNIKKLRIKHQIIILIGIAVLVLILVQATYYTRFQQISQEKATTYAADITSQVEEKVSSTCINMKDIASTVSYNRNIQEFLQTDDKLSRFECFHIVNDILGYLISSSNFIVDIILVDSKGRNTNYIDTLYKDNLKEQYSKKDFDDKQGFFLPYINIEDNDYSSYITYYFPIYSVFPESEVNRQIGTCIIVGEMQYFQDVIDRLSSDVTSEFLILDKQYNILASRGQEQYIGTKYLNPFDIEYYIEKQGAKNTIETSYIGKYIVQQRQIDLVGWKIVNIISKKELTRDMKPILKFGIIAVIILIIVLIGIGILIFQNIASPVNKIICFMNDIEKKHFNKRLNLKEKNEIGEMGHRINEMLDKIEVMNQASAETQRRLYETKLSKKQADLQALQSQINPHFLYNTLDCIKSIALAYEVDYIARISTAMAKIFRYSIKGDNFVSVRQELECIENYLEIINIRFHNRFSFQMDIDDGLMNLQIIKMILQPIVENAVYHGLEGKREHGTLQIAGRFANDSSDIIFEINDNGKGIDTVEKDKINNYNNFLVMDKKFNGYSTEQKRSIGLINIIDRIKLQFGDMYGLNIDNRQSGGTRVIIRLPKIKH